MTSLPQDHIMFTMGDDFQYQNAVMNYKNMDKVESLACLGICAVYNMQSLM